MRSLHYLLSAAFILALPIIGTSPTHRECNIGCAGTSRQERSGHDLGYENHKGRHKRLYVHAR
jgi:hypothetical protein